MKEFGCRLIVQPVVCVGVGVGNVVGFGVLQGVGVAVDGEGEVGAVVERMVTNCGNGIRNGDAG